ncbi:hypothetical protein FISHEDRAFT_62857 [Fistulina hepatica ATCC 64428]|uniref:Uncharacterized protein n=1 Tax=Fistulina hepatica ATCC 64428 TaxID=1128425 RepID=A0A0D7A063_9AGAR|nr:hypothetical protein FISHEDRAFT_62857 [Fistulina hepatica ATCC 64428]
MSASQKVTAQIGKGPYFARQIRKNARLLIERGYLPMSKVERRKGYHTLIDNENVHHGVHVYLAAQNLGTISPHELYKHLQTVLLPALGYTGQDTEISQHSVLSNGLYHDGHEQPDVVTARHHFVDEMAVYEPLMIWYEGEDMIPVYPILKAGKRLHIVLNHDECIYHFSDCVDIWEFDCSAAHEALAPNALNVNHMSVNPGELHPDLKLQSQPKGMHLIVQKRVTVWDKLYDMVGREKRVIGRCTLCKISAQKKDAICQIAEAEGAGHDDALEDLEPVQEATVDEPPANDWCCLYHVLSKQDDFVNEKPMIQKYLEMIEMLWGFGKYWYHNLADDKFATA